MTKSEFENKIRECLRPIGAHYFNDVDDRILQAVIDNSIEYGKEQASYESIEKCVARINELAEKVGCKAKVNIELNSL